MVTNIGNTGDLIIISDHATPGSGVYAWYLPASSYQASWPMGAEKGTRVVANNGTATGQNGLTLDLTKVFQDVPIVGWTDYSNLQKALAYWNTPNLSTGLSPRLYLSIKPAGMSSNNIAVVARFSDVNTSTGAVTLSQFTGKLKDYRETKLLDNQVNVNIAMYYEYYAEA